MLIAVKVDVWGCEVVSQSAYRNHNAETDG